MAITTTWYRCGSLIVAVGVFVASSWPSLSVAPFGWSFADKAEHALAYMLLAYLTLRGWAPAGTCGRKTRWIIVFAVLTFAGLDEYHQRWVPGRFVEWGDFAANCFGIFSSLLLDTWQGRRHGGPTTKRTPR